MFVSVGVTKAFFSPVKDRPAMTPLPRCCAHTGVGGGGCDGTLHVAHIRRARQGRRLMGSGRSCQSASLMPQMPRLPGVAPVSGSAGKGKDPARGCRVLGNKTIFKKETATIVHDVFAFRFHAWITRVIRLRLNCMNILIRNEILWRLRCFASNQAADRQDHPPPRFDPRATPKPPTPNTRAGPQDSPRGGMPRM